MDVQTIGLDAVNWISVAKESESLSFSKGGDVLE